MLSRTTLLLRVGEILQEHLPDVDDIKLMGDVIIVLLDKNAGGVTIEVRVNQLTSTDFQEAETLYDPQL